MLDPLYQLTVLGTPAEEGCGGKIDFINASAFDDIDIALISHPWAKNAIDVSSSFLARARYVNHKSLDQVVLLVLVQSYSKVSREGQPRVRIPVGRSERFGRSSSRI
jgi:hypothetical protein